MSSVEQSRARHEDRAKFLPNSQSMSLGQPHPADRKWGETRHNHRIQQQTTTEDAEKALKALEATRSETAASPGSVPLLVWLSGDTTLHRFRTTHASLLILTQLRGLPTGHSHIPRAWSPFHETAEGKVIPDTLVKANNQDDPQGQKHLPKSRGTTQLLKGTPCQGPPSSAPAGTTKQHPWGTCSSEIPPAHKYKALKKL